MAQKVYQSSEICGAHKSEKYAKQYYQSVIYIIQDRNDNRHSLPPQAIMSQIVLGMKQCSVLELNLCNIHFLALLW